MAPQSWDPALFELLRESASEGEEQKGPYPVLCVACPALCSRARTSFAN